MFADTLAADVSHPAAFLAGLLSFFSPCVLPLIPAYFTFITGYSLDELTTGESGKTRMKVMLATLSFVLGFSFVFIVLFGVAASFLGEVMKDYRGVVRIVGGILILFFGIHVSGLFRFKFLDVEKRLHLEKKPARFIGTFLIGMAFGAGWSPCIGPLLGSILLLAGNQGTVLKGVLLMVTYSAGLAIPFLLIAAFVSSILNFMKKATKVLRYVNAVAGLLLAAVGILLITDNLRFFG